MSSKNTAIPRRSDKCRFLPIRQIPHSPGNFIRSEMGSLAPRCQSVSLRALPAVFLAEQTQ